MTILLDLFIQISCVYSMYLTFSQPNLLENPYYGPRDYGCKLMNLRGSVWLSLVHITILVFQ
ncbi:hypothetical protein PVAP13_9KG075620 [Panicum virgatum]|uniref:Uncharacterized protein n=1 Tax=Panicum virgatum TaxID=38727 RepID=A0A8T0NDR5_PANVG|nr:hypothetical protein PVAP13_9KG075620 [Panicum virgatum]